MSDRTRDSELTVVEGLWSTLDDQQMIKDVVMKGKYISNAIKFIGNRNKTTIDEAKHIFFIGVSEFVNNLIRNKQLHRAIHVLKNVQLNEFYYFYDFYQVCNFFINAEVLPWSCLSLAIKHVSIIRKRKTKQLKS